MCLVYFFVQVSNVALEGIESLHAVNTTWLFLHRSNVDCAEGPNLKAPSKVMFLGDHARDQNHDLKTVFTEFR